MRKTRKTKALGSPIRHDADALVDAYLGSDMFRGWGEKLFVTVKFKARLLSDTGDWVPVNEQICRNALRSFGNRLDRSVFGNAAWRYQKRVRRAVFLEHGDDVGWHAHLVIEYPPGRAEALFRRRIARLWEKEPWASTAKVDIREANDGAFGYALKPRSKSKFKALTDALVVEATVTGTK